MQQKKTEKKGDEMLIREAALTDIEAIQKLDAELHEYHGKENIKELSVKKVTERIESKEMSLLVAELEGEVIGFSFMRYVYPAGTKKPYAFLVSLYLKEEHRNNGYGRTFFFHNRELARQKGMHDFELAVSGENEGALSFYKRIGMKIDYVHMSYSLKKETEG